MSRHLSHLRATQRFALALAFAFAAACFIGVAPSYPQATDPNFHFMVIHSFSGSDGASPIGQMTADVHGTYYGVTAAGGAFGNGVVYKTDSNGIEAVLHSFQGPTDGLQPNGSLAVDTALTLYGTTAGGGGSGLGVVYKIDAASKQTILHTFTGTADGSQPSGSVIRDASGNLFGVTSAGGHFSAGVVYKITAAGQFSVLYHFTGGNDGGAPLGALLSDASGNLFGTTSIGGANKAGVVFKLTPTLQQSVLYAFTGGTDGGNPQGNVVADAAGNLFGTTPAGGFSGFGEVFQITPAGVFSVLHSFHNAGDGKTPSPDLSIESSGRLYGATQGIYTCGTGTCGTVFRLDPNGKLVPLHYFLGTDGSNPTDLLREQVRDFGVTNTGGDFGLGVIYKINNL